jgi:LysR family hydrogen peroxide-inducible transcriptional activator
MPMSVKHLNLRDLTYVCTVAEHLSFGKAATLCAISQPAMSSRIQHIEEQLACRIFERSKRSVLITEKGHQIVILARSILDTAESIDQLTRNETKPLTGELKIGIISTLGPYLMPLVLGSLAKNFPDLDLQLTEGLTENLLNSLIAGSLDIVIATKPVANQTLYCVDLFFEPFMLAAPKNHPLIASQPIASSQLNGADMILLEEGHCLSGQALSVCPAEKRRAEKRLHATSLETLRHMIATGKNYSLLPYLAVGKNPPLQSLIDYLPLADNSLGRTIVLCSRKSTGRKADCEELTKLIRRHLPKELTIPSADQT